MPKKKTSDPVDPANRRIRMAIDPANRQIRMSTPQMTLEVAKQSGLTRKQARSAIDSVVTVILTGARKGSVSLPGLGTFSVIKTKARTGVKPGTTTKISIAAGKRMKFKASGKVKKVLQ